MFLAIKYLCILKISDFSIETLQSIEINDTSSESTSIIDNFFRYAS